ncbi:MAG: phenylalanine--tRNA ligase subunit alpha [Myxococcales bacterium]
MGNKQSSAGPQLGAELVQELEQVKATALAELSGAPDAAALEQARVAHLGQKGTVTRLFERIPKLPGDQRRGFGQAANGVKAEVEAALEARRKALETAALEKELSGEKLDVSLPGRRNRLGRRHPVSRTLEDLVSVFERLGFGVASGPEIELDYYNFEALNLPAEHPARDMQDTFYIDETTLGGTAQPGSVLLRTHTSPVQIRSMLARKPPLRLVMPGKVYRCDSDITHTPMFHQIEGLVVDEQVTFAELKGTLDAFVRGFFGSDTKTRFRPSYFPFTEPSAEVDVSCVMCSGKGCRVCKGTGWLEVLGCGMVHPNVFRNVGYDPERISGFAFGMGIERLTMLRYGIDDLRLMFENDARFLEQF